MDPLDWTHQWDDFEMMMYARPNTPENAGSSDDSGIFMQMTRKVMRQGAEEWEILYDRKIADLPDAGVGEAGSEEWEEDVLRRFLMAHPTLVDDEKKYLHEFLAQRH